MFNANPNVCQSVASLPACQLHTPAEKEELLLPLPLPLLLLLQAKLLLLLWLLLLLQDEDEVGIVGSLAARQHLHLQRVAVS